MLIVQLLKLVWARWKVIAHKFATFQSRAILFIFYYVVLAPFAVGMRMASDPLRLSPQAPRGWLPRLGADDDITASARRQF